MKEEKQEINRKALHENVDRINQCCIMISDNCVAIQASTREILALVSTLAENLKEWIPKEALVQAVEIGYASKQEILEMLTEAFKERFEGE